MSDNLSEVVDELLASEEPRVRLVSYASRKALNDDAAGVVERLKQMDPAQGARIFLSYPAPCRSLVPKWSWNLVLTNTGSATQAQWARVTGED